MKSSVGSYLHDQIGHGLTITGSDVFLEKPNHTSPLITTLHLAELLSLFDQQADPLLPISLFNSTFAKGGSEYPA